jgi:phospholipid/cholesterol/gamma-HCH transport system substrate-binding protein
MGMRREYRIAILVIGAVLLLIFGLNYLQGLDLLRKRNIYHAIYPDAGGMVESNALQYNGTKVGQVVGVKLMRDGSGRVVISYQIDESWLRIPTDSRITLGGDLFGKWAILNMGSSSSYAEPGDTLQGDAQLSLTEGFAAAVDPLKQKAEGMLANIDSVLTSVQRLLSDSTIGDIDASFSSVRGTLESFDRTARRIDGLVAAESQAVHTILDNIRRVSANIDSYHAVISRILTNMDSVSTALADGGIKRFSEDLAESGAKLKEIITAIEAGEGSLGALMKNDTLYTNLENASKELDLLLEDLRINPNRYVHLSLFGRKDRLPKLSDSDVDRIRRALQEDKRMKP